MAVVQRAGREGRPIPSRTGTYYLLAPGGGPELWVQIRMDKDGQSKLAGFNPHFRGHARMRFGAIGAQPAIDFPMEGTLEGWADAADETPESGIFPLSVEVPDFEWVCTRFLAAKDSWRSFYQVGHPDDYAGCGRASDARPKRRRGCAATMQSNSLLFPCNRDKNSLLDLQKIPCFRPGKRW